LLNDFGWRLHPSGRTAEFDSDHSRLPQTAIATAPIMTDIAVPNDLSVS